MAAMGKQEESTEIKRLQELVKGFTSDQLAYLAIRPFVRWDKDAAETMGVSPETISRWENKADVDDALRLMRLDGVIVAGEILRQHVPLAANELANQVAHRNVTIRHKAATEILDRAMGKAITRAEISGPDGRPIETKDADSPEHNRAISSLADAIGALIPGEGGTPDGPLDAAEQEAVDGAPEPG